MIKYLQRGSKQRISYQDNGTFNGYFIQLYNATYIKAPTQTAPEKRPLIKKNLLGYLFFKWVNYLTFLAEIYFMMEEETPESFLFIQTYFSAV